jgi:hypothetical protein
MRLVSRCCVLLGGRFGFVLVGQFADVMTLAGEEED